MSKQPRSDNPLCTHMCVSLSFTPLMTTNDLIHFSCLTFVQFFTFDRFSSLATKLKFNQLVASAEQEAGEKKRKSWLREISFKWPAIDVKSANYIQFFLFNIYKERHFVITRSYQSVRRLLLLQVTRDSERNWIRVKTSLTLLSSAN
jgi:hypothetical protein